MPGNGANREERETERETIREREIEIERERERERERSSIGGKKKVVWVVFDLRISRNVNQTKQ